VGKVAQIFVEINSFHAETLFFYHANCSTTSADVVFGNKHLFGQPLFDEIATTKKIFSLSRIFLFLCRNRVQRCHFNTADVTLYPITWKTIKQGLVAVLLPIMTYLFGCENACIMHDAQQFFPIAVNSTARVVWFRRLVGKWLIRLFTGRYVLAPEVAAFLEERGISVQVMDPRPLKTFPVPALTSSRVSALTGGRIVTWIGPVVSYRRMWKPLIDLNGDLLEALNVSIVMLCDSRIGEGPLLRAILEDRGLIKYFVFFERRPDDYELFSWVRRSSAILCLYSGPEYGTTKTSGARIIAAAFQKPYIATIPLFGVYGFDGCLIADCDSLTDCMSHIPQ
jgi:hypothetical protein